jgi:3-dehydroquinate synthase
VNSNQDQPDDGAVLRVAPPAQRSAGYDVIVRAGSLNAIGTVAAVVAPADRYAVLAPASVAALYGNAALGSLAEAGLGAELFTFADGEQQKTRQTWAELTDAMLERRLGRDSCIIALGGGVAGDIAGFVAATYMRGVPVLQVPTTLLAMLDAAVGGKTGIDTAAGKNLVGAFHPPAAVIMDPLVLRTLPVEELRSGVAEAIKHGAILDLAYFRWIEANADAILAADPAALQRLVARSVGLKARIVAEDPFEEGIRAILNFGHTVGHALERESGYSMRHGYAVAAGMAAEAGIGEAVGVTERGTAAQLATVLQRFGLPAAPGAGGAAASALLDGMRLDKKARRGLPRMTLLRAIGECAPDSTGSWTHEVPAETVVACLQGDARGTDAV